MDIKKIKALIIEDSKFVNTLFTGLLEQTDDIEVIGIATTEEEATTKIATLKPDIITLDADIPDMDAASFLDKLMNKNPVPVIMVSTLNADGAETTIRALEIGAVDYLVKPKVFDEFKDLNKLKNELSTKIRSALKATLRHHSHTKNNDSKTLSYKVKTDANQSRMITLCASVGGVGAVKQILTSLPKNSPPIIVSLQLHPDLVKAFASRLSALCEIKVLAAEHGEPLSDGRAYLGSTYTETSFNKKGDDLCLVIQEKKSSKPVDHMLLSLANTFNGRLVGAVLTGQGEDGVNGFLKIKEAGGYVIAQNENSCVIYDTPKTAKERGIAHAECSIEKISKELLQRCA